MKMEHKIKRCGFCNEVSSSLKWCGRCKTVKYCSRSCQSSDWPNHKTLCHTSNKGSGRQVDESKLEASQTGTQDAGFDSIENVGNETEIKENSYVEGDKAETEIITKGDIEEYLHDDTKTKDEEPEEDKTISKTQICGFCSTSGCSLMCSRCKAVYYCSKECQKQDWKTHKVNCRKIKGDTEKRHGHDTTKSVLQNNAQSDINFGAPVFPSLSPEKAQIRATPPEGSLDKAIKIVKKLYPSYEIVTNFVYVPSEPLFNFFPFVMPPNVRTVLLAFMYKYHEDVMRHGVYLKDDCDNKSKVEFYIDCDNPSPYFSFSQVKPGGYICIANAAKHLFRDGSVGMRIDKPEEVKILDIETVMK